MCTPVSPVLPPPTCWVLDRGEGAPLEVEESVREGQW